MGYQIFTLNNGIRVIHQPIDSPVSYFGIIINTGSRDEEAQEQGTEEESPGTQKNHNDAASNDVVMKMRFFLTRNFKL